MAQTRAAIMHALVALMGRMPYATITLSQIAEEADVAEKTVQRHFGSKSAIFAAFAGRAFAAARARLMDEADGGESPLAGLERLFRAVYSTYEECGERIWTFITAEHGLAGAAVVRTEIRAFGDSLTASLVRAWPDAWRLDDPRTEQVISGLSRFLTWKALRDECGLSAEETVLAARDIAAGMLLKREELEGMAAGQLTR